MEERGARRGSILDLFLVFLLLLAILSAVLRWERQSRESDMPLEKYLLTLETAELARESADCISVGERVYTPSGELLGEVTALEYLPVQITLASVGRYYRGEWPISERCVLRVEVTVLGRMRDGVLLHGGRVPLAVGTPQQLFSERAQLHTRVWSVSAATDEK